MNPFSNFSKHAGEVFRRMTRHQYDIMDDGSVYLGAMHATVGGAMGTAHRPRGGEFGAWQIDHNKLPTEGLIQLVGAGTGIMPQITQFYIAPYAGNVAPAASWKGSNFAANATEFLDYTSDTRLPWTITAPTTTPTVDNGAAIAAATMTFAAGGPYNLYGAAVLQAAAKGATTGKILMGLRFSNPRLNMGAGDDLAYHYGLTLSDAG